VPKPRQGESFTVGSEVWVIDYPFEDDGVMTGLVVHRDDQV
jgi:hypothetical protein